MIAPDDAASELRSAFLAEEEGTASSFRGLAEAVERHGLLVGLYTDRGSHRFRTPEAGGKVPKTLPAQVGRALKRLGIGRIAAYSPEARGRCERASRTLQDRPPEAPAPAGIGTVEAASRHPREVYLAEHDARFATPPDAAGSGLVKAPPGLRRDVLRVREERRAGNGSTVRWKGRSLRIPPGPPRPHLARAVLRVHEYPGGTVALFRGPRRLAGFPPATLPPPGPAASRPTRAPPITTLAVSSDFRGNSRS